MHKKILIFSLFLEIEIVKFLYRLMSLIHKIKRIVLSLSIECTTLLADNFETPSTTSLKMTSFLDLNDLVNRQVDLSLN